MRPRVAARLPMSGAPLAATAGGRCGRETLFHSETFYATNVTYDLARQWVAMPGKLDYDYRWLFSKGTPEVIAE
jgi:hypothetical protein